MTSYCVRVCVPFVFIVALCGCGGGGRNMAPTVAVLEPGTALLRAPGSLVQIDYIDDDVDDTALTSLYADVDGDPASAGDQVTIALARPEGDGSMQTVTWDTTGVAAGQYTIVAVTSDGSNVPATSNAVGVVTINAPPTVDVTGPVADMRLEIGSLVDIAYADDDPDDSATTDLFADADGDLLTTGDQYVIATGRAEQDGAPQSVQWDTSAVEVGEYRIIAVTSGALYASVQALSPGTLTLVHLISDDFEDGVIDTNLWEVLYPFGGSNATESGGTLNLSLRPYVATADEWTPGPGVPLVVEFDWTVASSISHLNLQTRCDATWYGTYAEASNAVGVNFSVQGGLIWGYTVVNNVAGGVPGIDFGDHPFSFVPGSTYHIRLEDDGSQLTVFIDDMNTPVAVGTTTQAFAINRVVLYNREIGSGADRFDNLQVSGVRSTP